MRGRTLVTPSSHDRERPRFSLPRSLQVLSLQVLSLQVPAKKAACSWIQISLLAQWGRGLTGFAAGGPGILNLLLMDPSESCTRFYAFEVSQRVAHPLTFVNGSDERGIHTP